MLNISCFVLAKLHNINNMNNYETSSERQSSFKSNYEVQPELSWWVKITTAIPHCIYYFGSFDSQADALQAQYGYIEDLIEEKAIGISVEIKQDRPKLLTSYKAGY